MNILVYENNINTVKENEILSKEIICPECNENILFDIKDYKINLFECKNNHIKNNLLLNEFENSQKIFFQKLYSIIVKIIIKVIYIIMNFIYVIHVG